MNNEQSAESREQRRYEIAKVALAGLLSNTWLMCDMVTKTHAASGEYAALATSYADALLAELEKPVEAGE